MAIYVKGEPIITDPETKRKRTVQRWKKDRVDEIPDGFTLRNDGRQGVIYYREGTKVLELIWELSGAPEYDILLYEEGLGFWVIPIHEPVSAPNQTRIREALVDWLRQNKTRASLISPTAPAEEFWRPPK